MPIPSRVDAARLLLELEPPDYLLAHSAAVAEIAGFLADRIAARGLGLDKALAEAAALLHDVDRALPDDHRLKPLGHGHAGAAWLTERGHPELAAAVAAHPVGRLSEPDREGWVENGPLEERVVAYADKRATLELVPLAERFADWERRHPEHRDSLRLARATAERLEQRVCAAAGVAPAEVALLPWVAGALERARA